LSGTNTSFLQKYVNYGRKKFYIFGPRFEVTDSYKRSRLLLHKSNYDSRKYKSCGMVVRQCSIDPEITGSDPAITSPQEKEVQKILFCRIFAKILFLQKTFFSTYTPLISETVKLIRLFFPTSTSPLPITTARFETRPQDDEVSVQPLCYFSWPKIVQFCKLNFFSYRCHILATVQSYV
jgi:hypothetical protein